jgi:hypothetical protein
VGRAFADGAGEELGDEEREDDLACELRVGAGPRLDAEREVKERTEVARHCAET